MKLIARAVSAAIYQKPPIRPGRENRPVAGPTPQESWTKSSNSGLETPEPISPKISCIGQIKNKKKMKELAKTAAAAAVDIPAAKKRRPPSAIKRILTGGKVCVREKLNVAAAPEGNRRVSGGKPPLPKTAPGLSQVKRFSSGRGALADFDWTVQTAPAEVEGDELEDGGGRSPVWIGEEVGPLQPRKEVNIWKRRTAVPPTPLQLISTIVKQK